MTHTNENHEIKRGSVFYVDLGKPDGTSKQAGIRPCVILSSAVNNRFSPTVNILTFSSSQKSGAVHCLYIYISLRSSLVFRAIVYASVNNQ